MTTDIAELHTHLDVLPVPNGDGWKVRLVVLSGPDFRSPHAKLGCVCSDRAKAERVRSEVAAALAASPPRLEGDRVVVDVSCLPTVGEGGEYPEV